MKLRRKRREKNNRKRRMQKGYFTLSRLRLIPVACRGGCGGPVHPARGASNYPIADMPTIPLLVEFSRFFRSNPSTLIGIHEIPLSQAVAE